MHTVTFTYVSYANLDNHFIVYLQKNYLVLWSHGCYIYPVASCDHVTTNHMIIVKYTDLYNLITVNTVMKWYSNHNIYSYLPLNNVNNFMTIVFDSLEIVLVMITCCNDILYLHLLFDPSLSLCNITSYKYMCWCVEY